MNTRNTILTSAVVLALLCAVPLSANSQLAMVPPETPGEEDYLVVVTEAAVEQHNAWGKVSPTDSLLHLHTDSKAGKWVKLTFSLDGYKWWNIKSAVLKLGVAGYGGNPLDLEVSSYRGGYKPKAAVSAVTRKIELDVINTMLIQENGLLFEVALKATGEVNTGVTLFSPTSSSPPVLVVQVSPSSGAGGGFFWEPSGNDCSECPSGEEKVTVVFCQWHGKIYDNRGYWGWVVNATCSRGVEPSSCPEVGEGCWYTETRSGYAGDLTPCSRIPVPRE